MFENFFGNEIVDALDMDVNRVFDDEERRDKWYVVDLTCTILCWFCQNKNFLF